MATTPSITFGTYGPSMTFTGGDTVGAISNLSEFARENGTYTVKVSFWDEDVVALIPTTITWSLYDTSGTVINSRLDVSVGSPAAVNNIVLTGSDLALGTDDNKLRRITIEAVVTTAVVTAKPIHGEAEFRIGNLVGEP